MDLQKVKEALVEMRDSLYFERNTEMSKRKILNAIAELEKPADDGMPCLDHNCKFFDRSFALNCGGESHNEPAITHCSSYAEKLKDINQYAESYHAKKCAECNRKERKYYPLGQEIVHIGCETCGHYDESKEKCGATDEQWATITDRDCNKENNYAHYIDLA